MYFVIGKSDCPYCDKAKALLEKDNTAYVYKDLNRLPVEKRELWKQVIKTELNKTTVPVVFNLIGGYDELKELLND
jgi:glutaredoxin